MAPRTEQLTAFDVFRRLDDPSRLWTAVSRLLGAIVCRTCERALPQMSDEWLKNHHVSTHWMAYDRQEHLR